MKVGDMVRRNQKYKEQFRKDVAIVIETVDAYCGTGPSVKLIWTVDNVGDYQIWHPVDMLEVVNESR